MPYIQDNLENLIKICEGIAAQLGNECEVVLHDLTQGYEHTIVYIINGHVTGRSIGGSGTNQGLSLIRGTEEVKDQYNYCNLTSDGRILKSSSVYFKNEEGVLEGSLCINHDITNIASAQRQLCSITSLDQNNFDSEIFPKTVDELLDSMISNELNNYNSPLTRQDKVNIVHNLDKKGALLIKKSADTIADALNISKFTLYNYLNNKSEMD